MKDSYARDRKPVGAEKNACRQSANSADEQSEADLADSDAEIGVEVRVGEQAADRPADGGERWHHIAKQQARQRKRFPAEEDDGDDDDAHYRHPVADCGDGGVAGWGGAVHSPGLKNRSSRSVVSKNTMLVRMTKQIAP